MKPVDFAWEKPRQTGNKKKTERGREEIVKTRGNSKVSLGKKVAIKSC